MIADPPWQKYISFPENRFLTSVGLVSLAWSGKILPMAAGKPSGPRLEPIRTSRLRLDLIPPRRAEEWFALREKSGVSRFHHWTPVDVLEVHWFLHSFSRNGEVTAGEWKQLGIYLRENGALIGDCGFRPERDGEAEIGYTVAPEFRRRGFAAEAVKALAGFLFDDLGIKRIIARTVPDNLPSIGLLEKMGFRRDRNAGETISMNGKEIPVLVYYL